MNKILIGVCAGALMLAACGGGSSNKSGASGSGAQSTTTAGNGGTSGGSGDNSALSDLAKQYAKAKIKITYTSSDSSDSTFTIAQDGNGKSAFTSGDSTFYTDGKSSISCQGTGSTADCTDLGSSLGGLGANIGSTFTATFAALAGVLGTLSGGDKSSESIAGRDASCVTYKASDVVGKLGGLALFKGSVSSSDYDPNDSAKICVDKQSGFVLEVSGTKKGQPQSELTATAVSEPSDSDFTPPVTPKTVPPISLPPGVTLPPGITLPSP